MKSVKTVYRKNRNGNDSKLKEDRYGKVVTDAFGNKPNEFNKANMFKTVWAAMIGNKIEFVFKTEEEANAYERRSWWAHCKQNPRVTQIQETVLCL